MYELWMQTILLWSDRAFTDLAPLAQMPDGTVILRPDIAGVIRAAYDPVLPAVAQGGVINEARETEVAEKYRAAMRIRTPSVFQKVMNLSGGNQQKVVLSKWLFTEPEVLILDEPTRGIDVGAKYEIYSIINDLSAQGKAVLMISSEMPELLGMCDRIYVMNEGAFVGELPAAESATGPPRGTGARKRRRLAA